MELTKILPNFPNGDAPFAPFYLDLRSAPLSEDQFDELCKNHDELKFEVSSKGQLIIVSPTSPETGWRNAKLICEVGKWSKKASGVAFDSSTFFTFPNGAKLSPDVSWMSLSKWETISPAERRQNSHFVPDFVIELLAPSDNVEYVKAKMDEYIGNGVRLGWLIDPMEKKIHIYRENGETEVLDDPELVSGENVLPGFELNLRELW